MALPPELYSFAENLYRRFPAEFVLLGMPGLEQVYDLRPNGSWSRSVWDSPTEKRISINLRRWNAQQPPYPPMLGQQPPPMPMAAGYSGYSAQLGQQPAAAAAYQPMPPAAAYAQQAPAAAAHPDEALRFNRLESALMKLTEQVEVILTRDQMPQSAPAPGAIPAVAVQRVGSTSTTPPPPRFVLPPPPPAGGSTSDDPVQAATIPGGSFHASAAGPQAARLASQVVEPKAKGGLASRRAAKRDNLQIDTKPTGSKSPVQVLHEWGSSDKNVAEKQPSEAQNLFERRQQGRSMQSTRSLKCEAVKRAAKDAADPVSPRSPGRFTPWA